MFQKKKIEFITRSKQILDVLEKPYSALNKLPIWYRSMPSYLNDKRGVDDFSDPNTTVKKCMPFFDAMTAGYYIPLPCDVWVEKEGGKINFKWSLDFLEIVTFQNKEQYNLYPIPEGYMPVIFKWINPWIIKTPNKYSCIFKHPTHYDDLPFQSIMAIVDTDKHPIEINFPFFLKKDFEGLIPKGTPIIQIIPFKRDNYKSCYHFNFQKYDIMWQKAKTVFFDRYKTFFRSPKKYEMGDEKKSKCPFHR